MCPRSLVWIPDLWMFFEYMITVSYLADIMDGQNLLAKCLKGLTIMREGLLQADAIKTDRVMSSLLSK